MHVFARLKHVACFPALGAYCTFSRTWKLLLVYTCLEHVHGSYSFELLKFHDFPCLFPLPSQIFKDLRFSFKNSKPLLVYEHFFDLKQFNRHKLWRSPKCVTFKLLNHKITISSLVIGLKKSYFPLIRWPSCYLTVCYWTVCNRTVP